MEPKKTPESAKKTEERGNTDENGDNKPQEESYRQEKPGKESDKEKDDQNKFRDEMLTKETENDAWRTNETFDNHKEKSGHNEMSQDHHDTEDFVEPDKCNIPFNNEILRPPILSTNDDFVVFEQWVPQLHAWFTSSKFEHYPIFVQQSYLKQVLDNTLRTVISVSTDKSTPIFGSENTIF